MTDKVPDLINTLKALAQGYAAEHDDTLVPMLVMLRNDEPVGHVEIREVDHDDEVDKKCAFVEASLAIRLANADEVAFTYPVETDNGAALRCIGVSLGRAFLGLLPYTIKGDDYTHLYDWRDGEPISPEMTPFDRYMVTTMVAALQNTSPTPTYFPLLADLLHRNGHVLGFREVPSGGDLPTLGSA